VLGELPAMVLMTACHAMLTGRRGVTTKETCGAMAAFQTRKKPVCWVHFQADTKGPRAGKVEFWEAKK
jgi:hypothetical protein